MPQPRLDRRAVLLRLLLVLGSTLAIGVALRPTPSPAAAPTLAALIAPLAPGQEVTDGFVLGLPHRGEVHDIVMPARRTRDGVTTVVELHILERGRWPGTRSSEHYSIAWELPRSTATHSESEAVTERLAAAVRLNDVTPGVPVDALALAPGVERPLATRVLERARGARGVLLALLLVLITWALATLPGGVVWSSGFLFALALALRLPHLDVPFLRDQDVQRVFVGHASLRDIFTGVGLRDRHPPLYFAVLHLAQLFGQAEAVVRAPAVLAGALVGPALTTAAAALGRRVELGALLGLVPAVAAAFVAHSREVSSLPLYALLLLAFATAVVRHHETNALRWQVAVISTVTLALFTYYTAVFAVLAVLALLLALGLPYAKTRRSLWFGLAAGSPALALAVYTFVGDRGARLAAHARPQIAWGERAVLDTAHAMAEVALDALGPAVLALALLAALVAARRRDVPALVPLALFASTFIGVAALAPVARVQPYYVMAALPALLLSAALVELPGAGRVQVGLLGVCGGAVTLTLAGTLAANATLYVPDARATMPAFVDTIADSAETRLVTVAHYDLTLLAYYLGRASGIEVDYASLEPRGDALALRGTPFLLFPLVQTHDDGATAAQAGAALEAVIGEGACLVIDRPALSLEDVRARLTRCERLAEGPESALYRCAPDDPATM